MLVRTTEAAAVVVVAVATQISLGLYSQPLAITKERGMKTRNSGTAGEGKIIN